MHKQQKQVESYFLISEDICGLFALYLNVFLYLPDFIVIVCDNTIL